MTSYSCCRVSHPSWRNRGLLGKLALFSSRALHGETLHDTAVRGTNTMRGSRKLRSSKALQGSRTLHVCVALPGSEVWQGSKAKSRSRTLRGS